MPTLNGEALRFGGVATALMPETALAAWGCRLIVDQDGHTDFLSDRQDAIGPRADAFCHEMNEARIVPQIREAVGALLSSGEMSTRQARDFTVIDNDWIEVHANTNASAGYCYVAAWSKGTTS